jgi:hypothetical protein
MVENDTEAAIGADAHILTAVRSSLRRAGIQLDRIWLNAIVEGRADAVQLADAAQAVHRAVVALSTPPEAPHETHLD